MDLVHVSTTQDSITVRDLYADVLVPTDGRHQRLLDLDEFADAIEAGQLDVATAVDGLRRWQRFLDRHLHAARDPSETWTDFPPQRLRDLAALPSPLGPVVTAPG
ncbi:putative RNA-binding protein associated with RNAse of E/G family [Actinophytocola algeriensis]|uniref:Putative RNA-binding protein associated with RNAse of E/G family n=1 Tax=Actinophytocola algeriensis TaxID=1768010 RepID=A0A7W7Q794_9PSEU|nr:putative RNA-binding protein associated with RNAse of E/G family [Actinophytocola algeriensis]MBE1475263.1 putative RNA-binding protein associated with RNAse of E/G family [Actinophytocola algeriensis]